MSVVTSPIICILTGLLNSLLKLTTKSESKLRINGPCEAVNSPRKGPVMRNAFAYHNVIILSWSVRLDVFFCRRKISYSWFKQWFSILMPYRLMKLGHQQEFGHLSHSFCLPKVFMGEFIVRLSNRIYSWQNTTRHYNSHDKYIYIEDKLKCLRPQELINRIYVTS